MNRLNNFKKDEPDISLDTFYDYFRELNADNSDDAPCDFDISNADFEDFAINNPRIDEIINGSVTGLFLIKKTIKHLA